MNEANKKALEMKSLGMAKVIGGSVLALALAATLTAAQLGQAKTDEPPVDEIPVDERVLTNAEAEPGECATASLSSAPTSHQMSCLMDVKAEYGTFDCQAFTGFETRLRADIEMCETKVSACLSEKPPMQVQASLPQKSERKLPMIIKREPAKLSQLGRAQPASETSSYFIQCDDKDGTSQWAEK